MLSSWFALLRMEWICLYRDRQAILYAIVLPIGLYPFLIFTLMQATSISQGLTEKLPSRILVSGPSWVLKHFSSQEFQVERTQEPERLRVLDRLQGGSVDAALLSSLSEEGHRIDLLFDSSRDRSIEAAGRVSSHLNALQRNQVIEWLIKHGIQEDELPFIEDMNVSSPRQMGGFALSLFLPGFLLVMATMAVSHPAIDITVGERERNTWETTLLLPVPLGWILGTKILAVVGMALLAVLLNLTSMSLSIQHLISMFQVETVDVIPRWSQIILLLATSASYALFMASIMILVASRAHHYSEAQSFVAPLYVVSMFPGFLTTTSNLCLDSTTAWIPLLNSALALKAIFSDSLPLGPFLIHLILSTCLALCLAGWACQVLRYRPLPKKGDS